MQMQRRGEEKKRGLIFNSLTWLSLSSAEASTNRFRYFPREASLRTLASECCNVVSAKGCQFESGAGRVTQPPREMARIA